MANDIATQASSFSDQFQKKIHNVEQLSMSIHALKSLCMEVTGNRNNYDKLLFILDFLADELADSFCDLRDFSKQHVLPFVADMKSANVAH